MTSSFEVRISEDADNDIRGILQHTLVYWGQRQHDNYAAILEHALDRLVDFPFSGRIVSPQSHSRRFIPVSEHVLFYRIDDHIITILRVVHKRSDYAFLLNDHIGHS